MKKSIILFMLFLLPASAQAIEFGVPLECAYGVDCFIQNYVDHDTSEDYNDYNCGRLSYNGHDGTDFRLKDYVAMEKGVNVIAAAPGVVVAIRDGMQDINVAKIGKDTVYRQGCGNAVVIRHEDGYQTSYCHMMQGSIRVTRGQQIAKGAVLGEVGLSGLTEFPHVHFSIKKEGRTVDPFTGGSEAMACGAASVSPLWDAAARQQLRYIPTALLNAAFSERVPNAEQARAGGYTITQIPRGFRQLVFWVDIMGIQTGDSLQLIITSPVGATLVERTIAFDRSKALYFQLIGKKHRSDARWSSGVYKGRVVLRRKGVAVINEERQVELR